ncbi:dodecin family protein [Defluviimonas sp. WL0002]|uniref:Dodecin family protein n=1 Tax=Albidovulum marisflavi TaxID=2984159 RepID=A0ABT2ZCH7_9RHOB|nr:dodecin family protein [Defluviimonas sp. WL0002]MCV2868858.1 dodecin family protein [Defluviimonas sp. WL0002]
MSIAKHTEITASGPSLSDAIENGVRGASQSLHNIEQVWVKDISLRVRDGKAAEYRVNMKLTFVVD